MLLAMVHSMGRPSAMPLRVGPYSGGGALFDQPVEPLVACISRLACPSMPDEVLV